MLEKGQNLRNFYLYYQWHFHSTHIPDNGPKIEIQFRTFASVIVLYIYLCHGATSFSADVGKWDFIVSRAAFMLSLLTES